MTCEKCKKENIQIISEYIELKEKETPAIYGFLIFLGLVLLIAGLALTITSCSQTSQKVQDIILAINISTGIYYGIQLIIFSVISFIIAALIKLYIPYRHITQTRAICLDCGNSWIIKPTQTTNTIFKNENDK